MDEVAEPELDAYPHFNAFFTRALKMAFDHSLGKIHCITSGWNLLAAANYH